MFGGDDVNAVVIDVGSSTTKAGYSGDDSPKAVFPSFVGTLGESRFAGESKIYRWRENMDLVSPLVDGVVDNWDALETLLKYSYDDRLRLDPAEHPLMFVEPAYNPRETREKLIELAFEKLNVPAFFLAKSPALAAFAAGKSTALVIDSGADMTCVTPVHDGYVLKKGVKKTKLAGNAVSDHAVAVLGSMGISITPQFVVAKKNPVDAGSAPNATLLKLDNTSPSFHRLAVHRVLSEFKEAVCQVSEQHYNEKYNLYAKAFEFPDGYNNSFGIERFKIPEILFQPNLWTALPPETLSIGKIVNESLSHCDNDVRPQLQHHVVLTGGNSLLAGFTERLHATIGMRKMHAAGSSTERRFGAWIGGSILSSLGTFQQMWISKKEYEEKGFSVETRMQ
ncbi:Actin-like protein 6B [Irineochytrium annulatum]|nr:Actin-like protein 6B [Irineochytrium annulatum]